MPCRVQLDDCKRIMKENQKKADQWTAQLRKLRKEVGDESTLGSKPAEETAESEASSEEAPQEEATSQQLILEGLCTDLTDEQLATIEMDGLQHEITVVSDTLQSMKPNMGAKAMNKLIQLKPRSSLDISTLP